MNDAVHQIEMSMEQAKAEIKLMDDLEHLTKNRHFKRVILDGYFEKDVIRLTMLKADPSMRDPDMQAQINTELMAAATLRQHFRTIYQVGRMAERTLEADQETREELLAEDGMNA